MHVTDSILSRTTICQRLDAFLVRYLFPLGLFVQLTGILWAGSRGGWITQTYLWLILPAFLSLLLNIKHVSRWRPKSVEAALLLFLIWVVITVSWSDTSLMWWDAAKRSLYIILYIYALIRLSSFPDKLKTLLLTCIGLVVTAALLSLIYHFGVQGESLHYRGYRISSLIQGHFADLGYPIMAGIYYGIFAVMLVAWQYSCKIKITLKYRLIAYCSQGILFCYIILTWSRGPWVAVFFGLLVTLFFTLDKKLLLPISVVLIAMTACVLLNNHVVEHTYNGRTEIWYHTVMAIMKHPLSGYGYDSSFSAYNNSHQLVHHPHNYFLQLLRSYGVVGFCLFIWVLTALIMLIFRHKGVPLVIMGAACLIVSLVSMLTDIKEIVSRPSDTWLYVWFPLGLVLGADYYKCTLLNDK